MIMKRKYRALFLLFLYTMLTLTACHKNSGSLVEKNELEQQGESGEKEQQGGTANVGDGDSQGTSDEVAPTGNFGYKLSAVVNAMAVSEKGYYFIANEYLYFYDIASGLSIPMCSRTECNHSEETCDAYIRNTHEGEGEFAFSCDRQELFYYNDQLYMVGVSKGEGYYLCRYSSTYNNKENVALLASFQEEYTYASDRGAYTIVDGYFYYYSFVWDYRLQYAGNLIELNCMRVKMVKGAVPEKLGSFKYAGDVTMSPLGCEGITVLTDGENVYYVAGHGTREFTTENKMEYILAKYTVGTKEFAILDSYAGQRNPDAWGEGLGMIHCNPNRVCMAEDKTMYINTEQTIVAINLETDERKKIYTSPYGEEVLSDLAYDGKYLYFIERQVATATYLTVIDTEGNLIRRYKFEYFESYVSRLENLASTSSRPENVYPVTGQLALLGVADEHILVASTVSGAYKGLSKETGLSADPNICYGVGMIDKSDFLENKEIEIKQIYQY